MDLQSPLASLMGANDAAALRVLSRSGSAFTGRQVAKLAENGNAASIRNALLRQVETGLVTARSEPHATYYTANREHLLWPAIEVALDARLTLEHHITDFATQHGIAGMTLALYGSVARGDSRPDSDIDLLVVFPDDVPRGERDNFITNLGDNVRQWTGNDPQVYDLTHDQLRQQTAREDPIVASWKAEAITLVGPAIQELSGRP